MTEKSTIPLVGDPDIFTEYSKKLGINMDAVDFTFIFSLDEEMFSFYPQPIYALLFIYPQGDKDSIFHTRCMEQPENLLDPIPWFTHQKMKNQCGTIALIHSVMNCLDNIPLAEGSWFANFKEVSKSLSPEERGDLLANDDSLLSFHENFASKSDISIPDDGIVDTHFIAFVNVGGKLWELDGRKPFPICHGECTNLLAKTATVIKEQFFAHIPENDLVRVSILGLSKKQL